MKIKLQKYPCLYFQALTLTVIFCFEAQNTTKGTNLAEKYREMTYKRYEATPVLESNSR